MNHRLYLQHFENINCMSMWYSLCVVQIKKKRMNWIEILKKAQKCLWPAYRALISTQAMIQVGCLNLIITWHFDQWWLLCYQVFSREILKLGIDTRKLLTCRYCSRTHFNPETVPKLIISTLWNEIPVSDYINPRLAEGEWLISSRILHALLQALLQCW